MEFTPEAIKTSGAGEDLQRSHSSSVMTHENGLGLLPAVSSHKARKKPSTVSPALSAGGLSISGQMPVVAKPHSLHFSNEGVQGEEHQEPLESLCEQGQMFLCALLPTMGTQGAQSLPQAGFQLGQEGITAKAQNLAHKFRT